MPSRFSRHVRSPRGAAATEKLFVILFAVVLVGSGLLLFGPTLARKYEWAAVMLDAADSDKPVRTLADGKPLEDTEDPNAVWYVIFTFAFVGFAAAFVFPMLFPRARRTRQQVLLSLVDRFPFLTPLIDPDALAEDGMDELRQLAGEVRHLEKKRGALEVGVADLGRMATPNEATMERSALDLPDVFGTGALPQVGEADPDTSATVNVVMSSTGANPAIQPHQTGAAPAVQPRQTGAVPGVAPRQTGAVPGVAPRQTGAVPGVAPRQSGGVPAVNPRQSGGLPAAGLRESAAHAALAAAAMMPVDPDEATINVPSDRLSGAVPAITRDDDKVPFDALGGRTAGAVPSPSPDSTTIDLDETPGARPGAMAGVPPGMLGSDDPDATDVEMDRASYSDDLAGARRRSSGDQMIANVLRRSGQFDIAGENAETDETAVRDSAALPAIPGGVTPDASTITHDVLDPASLQRARDAVDSTLKDAARRSADPDAPTQTHDALKKK